MTDKQIGNILADMVIIVDTREQKNQHILDYLNDNKIPYIKEALLTGDYSFYLPSYPQLQLDRCILVEKKNSLSEIAGNFTKGRDRFQREFERVSEEDFHVVIEDATFTKVHNGSYRSNFPPNSMMGSILTWNARYKTPFWFCPRNHSPELIIKLITYGFKEKLKNIQKGIDKLPDGVVY